MSSGTFRLGEVTCLLGQNGCGKTTFMNLLAAYFQKTTNKFAVSYKKQQLKLNYIGSVQDLLEDKVNSSLETDFSVCLY